MMRIVQGWIRCMATAPVVMLGAVTALAVACSAPAQAASTGRPGHVQVEVLGQGRPVLMIPGLNSAASVWRDTCQALRNVQCHLVQLPGFAGAAPANPVPDSFLPAMRDELLAYVRVQKLDAPAVIGHSLGGVLALQMAIRAPQAVGPLVIVDALPFYAGIQNPAATAASVQPLATQMRQQMLALDAPTYQKQAEAALAGMSNQPDRLATLQQWGRSSDRRTTAEAMYSLMVHDLRTDVAAIRSPALVLGAWAAYASSGATEASTRGIFQAQYAALPDARIAMSAAGYHFLMWDDPQWLREQVQGFLAEHP